jgi:putative tryptophan/tyrosine transport system substrate-binding protein
MKKIFRSRFSNSHSDNLKSKTCPELCRRIQNLKLGGLVAIAVAFALCGARAEAQQPAKVAHIGFLDQSTASGSAVLLDAFRQELSKLGWIEGKNLTVEYRFAEQKPERLPELAADLVRLKVDQIVVTATPAALAAKSATTTIPIVMTNAGDPVGSGFVASLARPGGNVTGLSSLSPELNTKRLEVLKDAVPKLARVGSAVAGAKRLTPGERPQACGSGTELKIGGDRNATRPQRFGECLSNRKAEAGGCDYDDRQSLIFRRRMRIVELAGKYRLPAIYPQDEFVEAGGLMSCGVDYADLFRRAAVYVDKILKGAKPADLPVQQATKFEFVINLKAAKQIGLTIPPELLARANRVIK